MANISDLIEKFILDNLGESKAIDISRNELANFFSCAPSQINYVLQTRFTVDRGFLKESHRGGGGFIRISKIPLADDDAVAKIVLKNIGEDLNYKRASQILDNLEHEGVISKKEKGLISSMISDEALKMPFSYTDKLRANAFKSVLVYLLSGKGEDEWYIIRLINWILVEICLKMI